MDADLSFAQRAARGGNNPSLGSGEHVAPLTFAELNRRLASLPDYGTPSPASRKWARIGLLTLLLAYLSALVIQHLKLGGMTELMLLIATLAIEIAGLALNVWNTRGEYRSLFRPFEDFADQLDYDIEHHYKIREWLVSQPIHRLEKYAGMAAYRRERYTQKLPLLAGSVTTLGIVPALIAVYLQGQQIVSGRALTWFDWAFGFTLLFFYFLTWTSSLTKSRLEAMDMHLQSALTQAQSLTTSP
jgi:hypothetical protein